MTVEWCFALLFLLGILVQSYRLHRVGLEKLRLAQRSATLEDRGNAIYAELCSANLAVQSLKERLDAATAVEVEPSIAAIAAGTGTTSARIHIENLSRNAVVRNADLRASFALTHAEAGNLLQAMKRQGLVARKSQGVWVRTAKEAT